MTGCSRCSSPRCGRWAGRVLIYAWIRLRGDRALTLPRGTWACGPADRAVFAFEFVCLFLALDYTTVTRTSVIFYTMPIWLALAAHVLIPGEQLTRLKSGPRAGLRGVVVAMLSRGGSGGEGALLGDISRWARRWAGLRSR
jgi:drug/metabolite transporter (DMT)-like permease